MQSTEVTRRLKELLGTRMNEDVVAAVEREKRRPRQPMGVLLAMDRESGTYWSTPFGLSNPVALREIHQLQDACRHFAETQLEPLARELERERIRAEVKAELGQEEEEDPSDESGEGEGAGP